MTNINTKENKKAFKTNPGISQAIKIKINENEN